MGYTSKLKERKLAIKLRRQGHSYNEILKTVPVTKSTLSLWCRDITLTPQQVERLESRKLRGAKLGRIRGSKAQQASRIKRTQKLIASGMKDVGVLTKRDRFVVGVGLYLGDGYKKDLGVVFSNSNPAIIKFMMQWFREFLGISNSKFVGQIWIHDNLSEPDARRFWSKLTNIPDNQLQKSYISKNKTTSNKIRKNIHKNGVFAIKIHSREKQRKIIGWMSGVLGSPLI